MAWSEPEYTPDQINQAGRWLVDPSVPTPDEGDPLRVLNNFRSSHRFPLNTIQVRLRGKAAEVSSDTVVTQRLKRRAAITSKLSRMNNLRLTKM